ncbi:MAG: hypothetical protein PVF13_04340 [Chromatiales bacterium]|jgi:hypothetical protein
MNSPNFENETPRPINGTATFRLQGVDHLPFMAQEELYPIIQQYFDYLEFALTDQTERVDIALLQEMLLELALLLRSGKGQFREDGYLHMLNRLTAIYAKGLRVEDDNAFASTAANFADILETVSQNFQDYDYSHSISILLHYMDRLFNAREESWLEVYKHLSRMPDSIHVMQQLRDEHLNEINGWIEEGVNNLYALWDRQKEQLANADQTLNDLQTQILSRRALLQCAIRAAKPGVVDLGLVKQQRELRLLSTQRDRLMSERCAKLAIVDLLETNIREFSDRLATMRRSTLLRLAWSNPERY